MFARPAMNRLAPALALAAVSVGCVVANPNPQATPQRPTFSQNTRTTEPGSVEVEAGVEYDQYDRFTAPVTVKYGITDGVEAFVGRALWQRVVAGGPELRGQGDTLVGSRIRIYQDDNDKSAAAFQAAVSVPNGSSTKGFSSGEYDWYLSAIYDGVFSDWNWTSFYQVQQLGSTGSSRDTAHAVAFAASRNIGGDTSFFGEVAGILDRAHSRYPIFATLGITFAEQPTRVWDIGIQMPINEDAGDPVVKAGVTYNMSKAKPKLHP